MPLQEQLDQLTARIRALVPPPKQAVIDRFVAELCASGAAERALRAGHNAPDFELLDPDKKLIRSADLLAAGPLVIIFFRGRWCPYCVHQIEAMRDALPRFRAAGVSVVGISPQTRKQMGFMAEQHRPGFPLLSDVGNKVARQFGLVYRLPDEVQELYLSSLTNLPFINGEASWELPMPAAYVISADGAIRYSRVDADFTRRPDPDELLSSISTK